MKSLPTVIAVCGLPRSGSSCLSGVLQHIGIPMGHSWLRPSKGNPKGFFEDRGLNEIRKACGGHEIWSHPEIIRPQRTIRLLRQWRRHRAGDGPVIGGKLPPFLARIIPEMNAAWPGDLRVIIPERPIMDSAKSASPGRFWKNMPPKDIYKLFIPVVEKQNADIERLGVPCLRIPFTDLLYSTDEVICRLIHFCDVRPTSGMITAALHFVDPRLNHHTKAAS